MRIFPKYDNNDRRENATVSGLVFITFVLIALLGLGLFFLGGELPLGDETVWSTVRWIGLIVGGICVYFSLQALLEFVVDASIGPERAIALYLLVVLLGYGVSYFF